MSKENGDTDDVLLRRRSIAKKSQGESVDVQDGFGSSDAKRYRQNKRQESGSASCFDCQVFKDFVKEEACVDCVECDILSSRRYLCVWYLVPRRGHVNLTTVDDAARSYQSASGAHRVVAAFCNSDEGARTQPPRRVRLAIIHAKDDVGTSLPMLSRDPKLWNALTRSPWRHKEDEDEEFRQSKPNKKRAEDEGGGTGTVASSTIVSLVTRRATGDMFDYRKKHGDCGELFYRVPSPAASGTLAKEVESYPLIDMTGWMKDLRSSFSHPIEVHCFFGPSNQLLQQCVDTLWVSVERPRLYHSARSACTASTADSTSVSSTGPFSSPSLCERGGVRQRRRQRHKEPRESLFTTSTPKTVADGQIGFAKRSAASTSRHPSPRLGLTMTAIALLVTAVVCFFLAIGHRLTSAGSFATST